MRRFGMLFMTVVLAGVGIAAAADTGSYTDAELAGKLAREIRMYPRYTIWDNVNIRVQDGNVALHGEVSQPFKKEDLARLAQRVPGVASVANELKVLPLSPFDDRLRLAVARAIYGDPVLSRYGMQALPPIHIVVDNGRVTLEGAVHTEMEKQVAGIRAATAGASFGPVVNNLRVESARRSG